MSKNLEYILIGLAVLILGVIAAIVYRLFLQFNHREIEIYAREEAAKFADKAAAFALIMDGVEHILGSHNLTQQVLRSAKATKTDKEQELVNAAVNQCYAFNYFAHVK